MKPLHVLPNGMRVYVVHEHPIALCSRCHERQELRRGICHACTTPAELAAISAEIESADVVLDASCGASDAQIERKLRELGRLRRTVQP